MQIDRNVLNIKTTGKVLVKVIMNSYAYAEKVDFTIAFLTPTSSPVANVSADRPRRAAVRPLLDGPRIDDEEIGSGFPSSSATTPTSRWRMLAAPVRGRQRPGKYKPGSGSISMYMNYYSGWIANLYQQALALGADRVSAVGHTMTVSFAEWNMPVRTHRIDFAGSGAQTPGAQDGTGNALTRVEVPFTFHRIEVERQRVQM